MRKSALENVAAVDLCTYMRTVPEAEKEPL